MLEQLSLFTGCWNIQFLNLFFVIYRAPCRARGHRSRLIFCNLRDTMPCERSLLSSLTTIVTYRTPCHARGHHSHFPPKSYLGKQRISLEVATSKKCIFEITPQKNIFSKFIFSKVFSLKH